MKLRKIYRPAEKNESHVLSPALSLLNDFSSIIYSWFLFISFSEMCVKKSPPLTKKNIVTRHWGTKKLNPLYLHSHLQFIYALTNNIHHILLLIQARIVSFSPTPADPDRERQKKEREREEGRGTEKDRKGDRERRGDGETERERERDKKKLLYTSPPMLTPSRHMNSSFLFLCEVCVPW